MFKIISAYGVDESDEDVAACMKETPGLSGSEYDHTYITITPCTTTVALIFVHASSVFIF